MVISMRVPVDITSRLYCRYVTNGSPLYRIGPLRMEVQSLDPYVVTLEEVVTPSEAAALVRSSAGFLERSATIRNNGGSLESFMRTSSTAWLPDNGHSLLSVLTHRIEQLIGVSARDGDGAEVFQAVNYGVGGHFSVHHDHVPLGLVKDRMLTFLMYLTDVPQGGRTVFPWVGVGVRPIRGSTLLWSNMNRAGVPDHRVQHGACPVLMGDKWVMNKWIYYGGQFRTLPCVPGDPSAPILRPLR
ncbi:LOW QUALITY PROTEIN: prolyl 4-hydroxylase subunit alpha-3-like [Penaeus chinensis]|uniref:LOW QUALITY PROTEIN: prolyl 4-hydroxylase subunit alpha-3-like n=1 Tax=Penaeus chinensis TaxID=139456 RepID=UPI001FB5E2DF|nr:LOW QUALITY PROTEIN: prolyl 4-hydroxylase subunit alpha-3-like [Penaeus chinensis]